MESHDFYTYNLFIKCFVHMYNMYFVHMYPIYHTTPFNRCFVHQYLIREIFSFLTCRSGVLYTYTWITRLFFHIYLVSLMKQQLIREVEVFSLHTFRPWVLSTFISFTGYFVHMNPVYHTSHSPDILSIYISFRRLCFINYQHEFIWWQSCIIELAPCRASFRFVIWCARPIYHPSNVDFQFLDSSYTSAEPYRSMVIKIQSLYFR